MNNHIQSTAEQATTQPFLGGRSATTLLALAVAAGVAVGFILFAFGEGAGLISASARYTNLALVLAVPAIIFFGSRRS